MNGVKRITYSAPAGPATIPQRFHVGTGVLRRTNPKGPAEGWRELTRGRLFTRPFKTYEWPAINPNVETLGYYQSSVRAQVRNPGAVRPEYRRSVKRITFELPSLIALLFLTGCRGAPSINLVGSFFPAWMLCVAIGVIGVLILRRVFVRTEIESHLGTLPLVYFSLWVLLTLGSWLLFFRG